jgi:predicted transcriptional regulator
MKMPSFKSDARTILAFGITLAAVLGITWLSLVIVKGDPNKAQNVLNSVLPLFGTWVGTVLAYYFSRENFEAASTSAERLLTKEERLRSIPVARVMIKNIISSNDLDDKVEDIFKLLTGKDGKRYLPILKPSRALEALLYREGIMSYLYDIPAVDRPKKTLKDLLQERPELNQDAAFVSEKKTLADAKEALEKIDCKVVLVTASGDPKEPVVGLLTSTDIVRFSTA